MIDDLTLMRLHVEALYTYDAHGRLTTVNTLTAAPAPRFFLGRTTEGHLWRFRHDLDDVLIHRLDNLCRDEPVGNDLSSPPRGFAEFTRLLAEQAPVQQTWAGPAYSFTDVLGMEADTVLITEENAAVLRPHFADWQADVPYCQPFLALLHDGVAVTVCASVRITPAAHEAGVETCPAFRGRGRAPQVVAAWAAAVRRLGATPLYSTSWENTASRAVARKLELWQFGADLHIS